MKKKRDYWFPRTRPQQRVLFANMKEKIGDYETILPLSTAKVARLVLISETFLSVYDYVEQIRATTKGVTDWQDLIFEGGAGNTTGDPAPAPPVFKPVTMPTGAFINIFEEFKELVDDIKHADNYTEGIGTDLMLVPAESEDLVEDELLAALTKIQPSAGYKVKVEGSLQGMKMMRVEYWAKGASIPQAGTFDKLPATLTVYPKTAGEPETGHLRAFLLKDNQQVGQPSPDYPVTLSA